jgi:hypothetical protein|tara:strand:- start:1090 stop:1293 length:204 start_codon:yes stop_codon:yes gene_type:complete
MTKKKTPRYEYAARPIDAIFPKRRGAMQLGLCPTCGSDATEFRDALSQREAQISGCCQACQDMVFGV